jgi:hypothetical protein
MIMTQSDFNDAKNKRIIAGICGILLGAFGVQRHYVFN